MKLLFAATVVCLDMVYTDGPILFPELDVISEECWSDKLELPPDERYEQWKRSIIDAEEAWPSDESPPVAPDNDPAP